DTGYVERGNLLTITSQLLRGGVDIIQLRAKNQAPEEVLEMALELAPICHAAGIPFILNDHPELVRESGADGAHVGQDDLSVAEARRLAGPGVIIGKSTHSLTQAIAAAGESPDYIGFGPLFATPTKPDYIPIGTAQITAAQQALTLPVFCIGGIKLSNLPTVLAAGAQRVVIVSDLLIATDPAAQTARCKGLLQRSGENR
ncbi:MAG: thiamine phosphate synthase, partial [Verrucomicrobia bacterium]|nr:thiamine phosphate synthase [Verrucomicrobiota bacterium]